MNLIEAIIIAIVEGVTEFLPISSTGHMILTQAVLGVKSNDYVKMYIVSIQLGAILSVIVLYWRKFFQSLNFYYRLFVAFLPAAVLGFLLNKIIDEMLESVLIVGISLLVGGFVLIWIDYWLKNKATKNEITYKDAFNIGLFQCLALIPGVSRSAATIIGGMLQKLDRKTAAEFSFFLAVPTMFAATAYKIYKNIEIIKGDLTTTLIVGNVVSFIIAIIAIKSFIYFLTKNGFKIFGYYRILVGLIILILYFIGVDLSIV